MRSPGEEASAGGHLRVASLNVFSGRTAQGVAAGAPALTAAAARLDVDVLGGQEVDRGQPRSGGTDQTAALAAGLQAQWSRFEPTVLGTPGETWVPWRAGEPEGPAYGICLVSRVPVVTWHILRLEPSRGRFPMPVPGRPPRLVWLQDEPRVALAAHLSTGVTVVCTHLSFVPGVNVRQLRRVRAWLEALDVPRPVVVLGDLNLPPRPVRRITGWTPMVTAPTFPGWRPGVQFDHVLGMGLPPGTRTRGEPVADLPVGDHRAVRVVLELPRR